jgi:hypothetical protein
VCRLDRAVGNGAVDPVAPRVAVGEHRHREVEFVVEPPGDTAGRTRRLALQVDDDRVVLLVEAVLDQPVAHAAGLHREDEVCVVV